MANLSGSGSGTGSGTGGGSGGGGSSSSGSKGGRGRSRQTSARGARVQVGNQYFIPGTESFGVPIGYRQGEAYVTNIGGNRVRFASNQERQDYEFEARMHAQAHRRAEEAAANARKAYLELAGSIAVVREALFVLGKTFQPLIEQSREFKDSQRQLAESASFSGMSIKELTSIQKEAMRSLQLNSKTAADVVSTMSQLSAQAGNTGNVMKNVAGLFDLATARGVTLKEAIMGMKQALSGSLEGTPLADKLFMKDLRAVLSDYAQMIGKRTLFDLTQAEKATAVMKEFERQTGQSMGAYSRFLETTSGKQAIFTERMEEFSAAVGHRLDKALSNAQTAIGSVVSQFMNLDRSTNGALTSTVAFLSVAGAIRLSLFGLVGTLTAVTFSLKSLNIEIGNTARVIGFLQRHALAITAVITSLVAVLSMFGDTVERSTLSVQEALVPLDSYVAKLNHMRTSLDAETQSLNENTSALVRNKMQREERLKSDIQNYGGAAADIRLMFDKFTNAKSYSEKEKVYLELVNVMASDAGVFSPISAAVKNIFGSQLSPSEVSSVMVRVLGESLGLSNAIPITAFSQDKYSLYANPSILISQARKNMKSRGMSDAQIDEQLSKDMMRSLVTAYAYAGKKFKESQEGLKASVGDVGSGSSKPVLEKPVIENGKIIFPSGLYAMVGQGLVKNPSEKYANAEEMSISDYVEMMSRRERPKAVDADTYRLGDLSMRLVGLDAFEIMTPDALSALKKGEALQGSALREYEKAQLQAGRVFNFKYETDKPEPGSFMYSALELSKRMGYSSPMALLSDIERQNPGVPMKDIQAIAIDRLAREQMRVSEEVMSTYKSMRADSFGVDKYNRALVNLIGEDLSGQMKPFAGALLETGMFSYMGVPRSDKMDKPTQEELSKQAAIESLKSYLPNKVRRGSGGSRSGVSERVGRVAKEYFPDLFEQEFLRLESQDTRFMRDNVPEALRGLVSDMNYEMGYTMSMERMRERAAKRIATREKEVMRLQEMAGRDDVSRQEYESAQVALDASLVAFQRLSDLIEEQKETVRQMTSLKFGATIGEMVRSGEMNQVEARRAFNRGIGQTIGIEDAAVTGEANAQLASAFEYMMMLPEGDRERLMPAYQAFVANVRRGRMSSLSERAVSIFQGANIAGSGDMATRGLAAMGMLSRGFNEAAGQFVSGTISAAFGGRELDSRAVYELKELEYRKNREALLNEDFETEKERRLRLRVLEEEREKYLESQVDTFGSRMREVFSETADFAGQVFNQVLTQLLVSSLTQGAGRGLLSLGLSFIPGGSAIKEFLGLSSGGVMPSGSVAIVGENRDGSLNSTSELVATRGLAKVFNNAQTGRVMEFISRQSRIAQEGTSSRAQLQQVSLLRELVRETSRTMVLTERGGEVLFRRSDDYSRYRERFVQPV